MGSSSGGKPPRTPIVKEYSAAELDQIQEILTYEQMSEREKFVPQIDSDRVKPVDILGFYPGLAKMIQCGRSGCRAFQRKGYHVLCDDGSETNIGEECGEKILGVSWGTITGGFNNQWRQKMTLNRVRAGIADAPRALQQIDDLAERPLGVRWLYSSLREFDGAVPPSILSEIKRKADRGEAQVLATRERTDAELAVYDAQNAPANIDDDGHRRERERYERSEQRRFITEQVGAFMGLAVFTFDGRAELAGELKPKFEYLAGADADSMPWRERRDWERWLRDVEARYKSVEKWIDDGIDFFGGEQIWRSFNT